MDSPIKIKDRWASLVHRERNRLDISRADFAKYFGISGQSVAQWETGSSLPKQQHLSTFAHKILNWRIEELEEYLESGELSRMDESFNLGRAIAIFESQDTATIVDAIHQLSAMMLKKMIEEQTGEEIGASR